MKIHPRTAVLVKVGDLLVTRRVVHSEQGAHSDHIRIFIAKIEQSPIRERVVLVLADVGVTVIEVEASRPELVGEEVATDHRAALDVGSAEIRS